jgi:hypothetical protein
MPIEQSRPIAQKVLRFLQKCSSQKPPGKIIDLNSFRALKNWQKELEARDLSGYDPLHAVYIDAQNKTSVLIEALSALPAVDKLNQRAIEAEDIYLPSGPPMSPLSSSYFFYWSALDMSAGITRETYTSILLETAKVLGVEPTFDRVLKVMAQSRMGLYVHENQDGHFVYLRELYTNRQFKVHSPAKYLGIPGEIWFVRLLPDPFGLVDYWVALTTPYVIVDLWSWAHHGHYDKKSFYGEQSWIDFIARNLSNIKISDRMKAYDHFMKYGLTKHYWLEYVFLAYVNHQENVVWLTGFPDRLETLPHSQEGELRFGQAVS